VASYLQLVAGAQLRHLDATVEPSTFQLLVGLHIVGAVAVTVLAAVAAATVGAGGSTSAGRWAKGIVIVVGLQLLLGAAAWVANWGMPSGLLPESWQLTEPLRARSGWNAVVVTGHVVLGMMILGASVVLTIEVGALGRLVTRRGGADAAAGRAFA
jgi:cytochrome c oxidase assembly protein subunit 15